MSYEQEFMKEFEAWAVIPSDYDQRYGAQASQKVYEEDQDERAKDAGGFYDAA